MLKQSAKQNWLKTLTAVAAACLFLAGCTPQTEVTSEDIGSGGSGLSGSLFIDKTYPTLSGSSWTVIQSAGRIYVKGLQVTVEGRCSRGVATIKVDGGSGYYDETAGCNIDGEYTWNRTFSGGEEGDRTLTFKAFDIDGLEISGAVATQDVRVDNTPPTSPVVTTPGASPFNYNGTLAQYQIVGTNSTDTYRLTRDSSTITPSGTNWDFDTVLVQSASENFSFIAWDLAGNSSAPTTITITWNPSASLLAYGAFSGGASACSGSCGSGATLKSAEITQQAARAYLPGGATNITHILSGFNETTNQLRAD
jgi:hypothetical protein